MNPISVVQADGRPLPPTLKLVRAVAGGGRLRRRIGARALVGRLPAFIATYPDGRRFGVEAKDRHYAHVFFGGEYEPAESQVLRRLLRPGDFVVDVGAHMGWFTILMAAASGPGGRVWSLEPTPTTRTSLEANLALNGLTGVDVLPLALGDRDGTGAVYLFEGLPHGHASTSMLGRSDATAYPTEVRRLDGLVEQAGSSPPVLVKLDAEGGELSILEGATQLLASEQPPLWLVEVNRETAAGHGYEPPALLAAVRRHGEYEAFRITPAGLVHEATPAGSHGISWLLAPPAQRERYAALIV